MMRDVNQEQIAQGRLDRFGVQFGETKEQEADYRRLVRCAAMSIVLTPELIGYLRGQFVSRLDWWAEADFLLSELCRPVGYERYVMDMGVQRIAVAELEREEPELFESIARVLVGYVPHLARTNPYLTERQLKHQQWAAMLCVGEMRDDAIGQMVDEFEHLSRAIVDLEQLGAGKAEFAWLAGIVQEMTPRLLEHSEFVQLAVRISEVVRDPELVDRSVLQESFRVGDRTLAFPMALLGSLLPNSLPGYPELQRFEFETASIEEGWYESLDTLEWQNITFEFKTARLSIQSPEESGFLRPEKKKKSIEESGFLPPKKKKKLIKITLGTGTAVGYIESLGHEIDLNMVKIPSGRFLMGAPEYETESDSDERPQHLVTVPEFYMGQHLVTQAQWRSVAALPQIKVELDANPSRFKGNNLPVEQVLWNDCVEFCARLSASTGRDYRLPSEAEWEYACRAGTTTPFYFGETIDAELANYQAKDNKELKWSGKYRKGRLGEYREKTTIVGTFPANDFGLYDMHGNLWEWCADDWHDNYEKAPTDGSVWNASDDSGFDPIKVLRGGAWVCNPRVCRSAYRPYLAAGTRDDAIGFRVVSCVPSLDSNPRLKSQVR